MAWSNDDVINESPCWSRAHQCPAPASASASSLVGTGNESGASCEAWYRCDGLSNYVISWWCRGASGTPGTPGTGTSGVSSSFKPSAILACDNSSSSMRMDRELCPPPVVCPGSVKGLDTHVQVSNDDSVDIDIILAIALAIFALIVLAVMSIFGYKYWVARKRHRQLFYHQHRPDRPYRALSPPRRSGTRWFPAWGGIPRHLKFAGKSGTVGGIHYTDVYIPSHSQTGTLLHRQHQRDDRAIGHNLSHHHHNHNHHHNFSHNHNSTDHSNNYWGIYRTSSAGSPKQRRKVKRAGKFIGDRFVATGSFVYQPSSTPRRTWRNAHPSNTRERRLSGRKDIYSPKINSRRWTTINSIRMQELQSSVNNNNSVRSPSSLHYDINSGFYFKGHNRENYGENSAARPVCYYVSSPTPEYHSIMSSNNSSNSNDNNQRSVPQVSSIQIPSYEGNGKTDNKEKSSNSRTPYDLSKKYNLLLSNTSYDAMKDPYLNPGYQRDIREANVAKEHDGSECGSWRSNPSVSPYALGRIHYRDHGCGMSEAASIASKNWHYTVFSQQQQQQQQQHNAVVSSSSNANFIVHKNADVVGASSMKNSSNYFLNSYYKPTPNSPDVVSSHNVSHRVTHITQDSGSAHNPPTHRRHHRKDSDTGLPHQHPHHQPVLQDFVARITVPSYTHNHRHQELTSTEINGGNITRKTESNDFVIDRHYDQRVHIPGIAHDTWSTTSSFDGDDQGRRDVLKSQELSYDCFRNEHLRQLARQETVASASTLDKTVGQLSTNNIRGIPHHY